MQVEWHLTGFLVPLLAGTWSVRVGVDEIGGRHDFTHPYPPQSVPVTGSGSYRCDLVLTGLRPGRNLAARNPETTRPLIGIRDSIAV